MMSRSRWGAMFSWAWPTGSIDQLLQSAAVENEQAAQSAWREWANHVDLDEVRFNEMRLLAAVSPRVAKLDPSHPARRRIAGIERMLWSRSQVVLREAQPALAVLQEARIDVFVLKGAARVARDPAAVKSRIVNDVDILVHPRDFRLAFDLLDRHGWRSTSGGTPHFHRTMLDNVHGLNMIHGRLADLDVHRSAFHPPHQSLADDVFMWNRAESGFLGAFPVHIPSATDSVAMALAHGGMDGHTSSDWLLDVVAAIAGGRVDWELMRKIIERRRLEVPAAVTLTYVAERLGSPVPPEMLDWVTRRAKRHALKLTTGLLLAHPKTTLSRPLKLARGIAKIWRNHRTPSQREASPVSVTRRVWQRLSNLPDEQGPPVCRTTITPSDRAPDGRWQGVIEATISVDAPHTPRRIEFELNTDQRHVARVKHRKLLTGDQTLRLRFRVPVTLEPTDSELILESTDCRGLRPNAPPPLANRYRRLPFQVVEVRGRRR